VGLGTGDCRLRDRRLCEEDSRAGTGTVSPKDLQTRSSFFSNRKDAYSDG